MPAIAEMRAVCQQRRPNAKGKMVWTGHWFNRLVTRWFSIYLTWVCVKLNISANQVTFMMIIAGLAGVALSIPHLLWLNIIGGLLLFLGEVLDCVDGEVARWTQKSSLKGLYLDLVNHVLCNAPASAICGFHLYAVHRQEKYLILGFLAYAMAQIRLGLKGEYFRVLTEYRPHDVRTVESRMSVICTRQHVRGRVVSLGMSLLPKCVDEYIIRMATVAAILLSHAQSDAAMVFLAWWFVVFGAVRNMGEIIIRYYVSIPSAEHKKRLAGPLCLLEV